ncbi:hypothetical protein [Streptomyces sp. NBC_01171]|uniref:hypothetical protein n=1 Tax=Streptomyces sp. NBC_01171 TaxID=2903757 RepID=UPI00386EFAAB|nr:hypothetical protein OG448_29785 [Streptomyces sp. NBC_01171]
MTGFLTTSITHFIEQILTQEHEPVGAVLHHLHDVALAQALDLRQGAVHLGTVTVAATIAWLRT